MAATTPTQADVVLRLLTEAGEAGVSARTLVYEHGITRGAAIVWSLRHQRGLNIVTTDDVPPGDGRMAMARYTLHPGQVAPGQQPAPTVALCTCSHSIRGHLLATYSCMEYGCPCQAAVRDDQQRSKP
jgi:hypothetical protein